MIDKLLYTRRCLYDFHNIEPSEMMMNHIETIYYSERYKSTFCKTATKDKDFIEYVVIPIIREDHDKLLKMFFNYNNIWLDKYSIYTTYQHGDISTENCILTKIYSLNYNSKLVLDAI